MAQTSNIRFRCSQKLKNRSDRIAKIEFGSNWKSRRSELGRKAHLEFIERKEREHGLVRAEAVEKKGVSA